MSPDSHVFHEIFLHINWHCHDDAPLIRPEMKASLYQAIQEYCRKSPGVYFKSIGGTATHIHLAIQTEPNVCPSDFIGKAKGYSSYEMNKKFQAKTLKWQKGYGIVSAAKKDMPAVIRYIEQQEEHHKSGKINNTLETWRRDVPEGEYVP